MTRLFVGPDGLARCRWVSAAPEFAHYHDHEWGYPVGDDNRLFEKICLEGFQSGLSWRTILNRREGFRAAFCGFDFQRVAMFTEDDVEKLLGDENIIRHRGKITAAINNARRAVEMVADEGSLADFFWRYEEIPDADYVPQTRSTSLISIALSKELKRRGWKFIGPTTAYAFMQAMGLINDHAIGCHCREKAAEMRDQFSF